MKIELLQMLSAESWHIDSVDFDDLSEDDKASIIQARKEYENGETFSDDDIDWN